MTNPPPPGATVHVDVVAPGRALITGPGFSGHVSRRGGRGALHIEDVDTETHIGTARSYRDAGQKLAAHHNLTTPHINVEYEQ